MVRRPARVGTFYQQEDDPIGRPPPSVSDDDDEDRPRQRTPIGVPRGYVPPGYDEIRQTRGGLMHDQPATIRQPRQTRYYDGDEHIPGGQGGEVIAQWQMNLARVGLLTEPFIPGYWDESSLSAYKQLLTMANQGGYTADALMQSLLATREAAGPGETTMYTVDEFGNIVPVSGAGAEAPPLVTRTTDPAILRRIFRRAVIDVAGEGWNKGQIEGMVRAYNSLETQRQTDAYNAQLEGGSYVDIPSPEAFADQFVYNANPEAAQRHEMLGYTTEAMGLLGSPAWSSGGADIEMMGGQGG